MGKGRVWRKREQKVVYRKEKRTPLIGDVQEYRKLYKEGGEEANQAWILKY